MDPSTRIILSVALLLALNNAIVRLPWLKDRELLFWAVQILDVVACCALILYGIPGFEEIPIISWMLGLLFLLHVAQNLRWRARRRREHRVSDETEARRSAIRDALNDQEGDQ
jgi:hypothetical protein